MDLKEFYFQNIKESEYHYRFLESVKKVNYTYNIFCGEEETQNYQFEIYDVEEAITKFKELCQPDVDFSGENKCWFYLITYYLHMLGYEIKEFPRILARPPVDPTDFTYRDIRNRIIALGGDDNGKIAEIANLIENLLKQDGKFITPEYEDVCCGFIDDTIVKNYRKKMQCFRHCTDEAIEERKTYSEEQKNFLVDYGLTMVKAIHELVK